jgi:hypothetical protein
MRLVCGAVGIGVVDRVGFGLFDAEVQLNCESMSVCVDMGEMKIFFHACICEVGG